MKILRILRGFRQELAVGKGRQKMCLIEIDLAKLVKQLSFRIGNYVYIFCLLYISCHTFIFHLTWDEIAEGRETDFSLTSSEDSILRVVGVCFGKCFSKLIYPPEHGSLVFSSQI